jgi:glucokinase
VLLLTGDVGGTKTHLALCRLEGGRFEMGAQRVYPSAAFSGLEDAVLRFRSEVSEAADVEAAGFGVAGPVFRGRCQLTNLPWRVLDAEDLTTRLGCRVRVLNDFEAVGFGVPGLSLDPCDGEVLTVQRGDRIDDAPIAVLGAGTGLGEALVLPASEGAPLRVVPGEGGHCDFAPQSALEAELLAHLRVRHGHVSWERVLSGPGLGALLDFFMQRAPERVSPDLAARRAAEDPAAVATGLAAAGDALCAEAVDLFLALYGAEAGNLGLRHLARGGVYLAGGIGRRIADRLAADDGPFLRGFRDKGRFAALMATLPVHLVLSDDVALRGAAAAAAQRRATT